MTFILQQQTFQVVFFFSMDSKGKKIVFPLFGVEHPSVSVTIVIALLET